MRQKDTRALSHALVLAVIHQRICGSVLEKDDPIQAALCRVQAAAGDMVP